MGDNIDRSKREKHLNALEIKQEYDKKPDPIKGMKFAKWFLKKGWITNKQYTWLAGKGCLGSKAKWEFDEYNRLMKEKHDQN